MPLPFCLPIVVPWRVESNNKDKAADSVHARLARSARPVPLLILSLAVFGTVAWLDSHGWFKGEAHHTDITAVSTTTTPQQEGDALMTPRVCRSVPLFVDSALNTRRRNTPRPRISIVFITKRPGGYDILLHSLKQQKLRDTSVYELICVDELAWARSAKVYAMADELGIPLVAVVPSKPKARANMGLKFGIYNAINTGILLARGDIVTFVMDMSWIPDTYLERTLEFYRDATHNKSLLGYPENFYSLRSEHIPDKHVFTDQRSITIFSRNQTVPFSAEGSKFMSGGTRPEDMVRDYRDGKPMDFEQQPRRHVTGEFKFWELSFATCPFSVLEELNGVEEEFDYGDDCHEANIQLRSEFLGYDLWIDGQTVVQNLHHKGVFQKEGELWNRFAKDTIQDKVILQEPGEIARGERGVESRGHDFDLKQWRANDCAANL